MKIKDNRCDEWVMIVNLNPGDVFSFGNDIYIVTSYSHSHEMSCVRLSDGYLTDIDMEMLVYPLDAEVTVTLPKKSEVKA